MRILYVYPGPVPPPQDRSLDRMFHVPAPVGGDILYPVWFGKDEVAAALGADSYPEHRVNNFTYHIHPAGSGGAHLGARGKLGIFWFFLTHGYRLTRKHRYDAIMTYGWTLTGVAAWILRMLSGAKFIVEMGNAPHHYNQFGRFGSTRKTVGTRVAKLASDLLLRFIAGSADRLQLRYPTQLDHYPRLKKVPATVMHGYIAVSRVPCTGESDNYILTVGGPWYLKGVDVLVKAFQKIHTEFPSFKLRLVGLYTDREQLDVLAAGNKKIEFVGPLPNPETLEVISKCSVFVLASRTEAGGRVLLESMAAAKPLVASDVDGNPYYVRDGVNGLVFRSGNDDDLAAKLRILLSSPELRHQFGNKGREIALTKYVEPSFGQQFAEMVRLTVVGR